MLRKLASEYDNPLMIVTENGVADLGGLDDDHRIQYYHDYLREMLIAINRDKINVKGYFIWSLLDNFEWAQGYKQVSQFYFDVLLKFFFITHFNIILQ